VNVTLLGAEGAVRPRELSSVVVDAGRKVTVDLTPLLNGGLFTALVESNRRPIAIESKLSLAAPYSDVAYNPGQPLT
jgi:hypothetical protein